MPPKAGRKRPAAKGGAQSADAAEIDAKLAAVDLLGARPPRAARRRRAVPRRTRSPPPPPRAAVAEMRSQLEASMEPAIEEMRKEVGFLLMRLPTRVKAMRMSNFLRECGGDVALLAEKERRAGK